MGELIHKILHLHSYSPMDKSVYMTAKILKRTRKRNVDDECRIFNDEWGVEYFFVPSQSNVGKAICVICNDIITVMKEYNLRRHYDTKHASTYAQFNVVKILNQCIVVCVLNKIYLRTNSEYEALTLVSIKVAYLLGRKGNPFMDGNIR